MPKSKEVKREEAKIRQEKWDALTLDEKIKKIKKINPNCKQLKKLLKQKNKNKKTKE